VNRAIKLHARYAWLVEFEQPMAEYFDLLQTIREWCEENCSGTYSLPGVWSTRVAFVNKEDAHLFFLTFR
jgi:hypothetical protein